jgi:methylmalonyl-CoA mutase N-terminal domain/subunit
MKEKYGARDPRSWLMRFHTQTAGCSLTAQQPENNIVRTAFQGLAAVLGGTQSLHTNSMDETHALPSAKAVKIALRTQQIIGHESGVANTIDPLGGSYFVEAMTNRLEAQAEAYFEKIEAMGGVVKAIEKGFFQREIAHAAYQYQRNIEEGKQIIVGVNDFVEEDEAIDIPLLRIDPQIEEDQVAGVKRLRMNRDNGAVKNRLEVLAHAAQGRENLIPFILEATRAYATLGEICDVLRGIFGVYREPPIF